MRDNENFPTFTSMLQGFPTLRGYPNCMCIHRDATVATNNGVIQAREYFHEIEYDRRKMSPAERKLFIASLNPKALQSFRMEMPFILDIRGAVYEAAVETWYRNSRHVAFLEILDTQNTLFRYVEIPNDHTDPEIHIAKNLFTPKLGILQK